MFMSFSVRTLERKSTEARRMHELQRFDIGVVARAGGDAWFAMRRSGARSLGSAYRRHALRGEM